MINIVLIDDNEIDLFVNRKLLEVADLSVKITDFLNPKYALEHLKKEKKVDLILVDHQMSSYTGYSFLNEFYNLKLGYEPKIAVLTASANPDEHLQYNLISKDIDVWEKPLNIDLIKAIFPI
ncbi:MAG: two-component system nitrate/nitrite response regulator NarL [Bacteroidia bacterium]